MSSAALTADSRSAAMATTAYAMVPPRRPGDSPLAGFLLFEVVYAVTHQFGLRFFFSVESPFWFPDSVLLCALLVSSPRRWWWFPLGALPLRLFFFPMAGSPLWFLFTCWLNDALKATVTAWLLRRFAGATEWLDDLASFTKYLAIAVLLIPALSAVGGAATWSAIGEEFGAAWRRWFLGNALAALVLTPLLVTVVRGYRERGWPTEAQLTRALLFGFVLTLVANVAFLGVPAHGTYPPFLLALPVPLLLAAALRFGLPGVAAGLLVVTLVAIHASIEGRGPFDPESADASLVSIQLFLLVTSLPFMFLSVLGNQQRRTDRSLRESEHRFRSLVDSAPVMVWMAGVDGCCTFVNRPWLDFTGRSFEEEMIEGRAGRMHPDDRRRWGTNHWKAVAARAGYSWEYRLLRWDGSYRWILESSTPRFDADRRLLGFIASCVDISDRREGEEKLRNMSTRLLHAQEAERMRIGQELHDDIAQRAAALTLGLSYVARRCGQSVVNELDALQRQAGDLCRGIRQVSHQLRPVLLDQLGLPAALRELCVQSSTKVQRVVMPKPPSVPPLREEVAIVLYRIAQEAVRNAVRHSGSADVEVDLRSTEFDVRLSIRDTGRGFIPGAAPLAGLGLSGMRERIRNAGGTLDILSTPGTGTVVLATVPLNVARVREQPTSFLSIQ